MTDDYDFSGIWLSTYRVPSGPEKKITEIEHYVVMHHKDSHLIIESMPNKEGSYMIARFTLDGRIVTGSYHSQNAPKAAAKGANYYGAAQLMLDPDGKALRGKGVGFGRDGEIKISDWQVVRVGKDGKLDGEPFEASKKKAA